MASHRFCISPPGNGADCHRVWECLYLGVIPIVQRDLNYEQYDDLPILLVDDWNVLTREFLDTHYERIQATEWNLDKLGIHYWRHRIQESRQHAMSRA